MILMKFLKKYKSIFCLTVVFVCSIFFSMISKTIISDYITCISITFAFSQSFLLATYANKDINIYMKKHKMFDTFIKDNRKFIESCIYSLIFLFILGLFPFNYQYNNLIYFSSTHLALLIIIKQLNDTLIFAKCYMNVYKNSYSDKVIKKQFILEDQSVHRFLF